MGKYDDMTCVELEEALAAAKGAAKKIQEALARRATLEAAAALERGARRGFPPKARVDLACELLGGMGPLGVPHLLRMLRHPGEYAGNPVFEPRQALVAVGPDAVAPVQDALVAGLQEHRSTLDDLDGVLAGLPADLRALARDRIVLGYRVSPAEADEQRLNEDVELLAALIPDKHPTVRSWTVAWKDAHGRLDGLDAYVLHLAWVLDRLGSRVRVPIGPELPRAHASVT